PVRKGAPIVVDTDEHPRRDTSLEKLAGLRTIHPGGTVTAGNASGINDGSCALVVASPDAAGRYGMEPKARVIGMAVAGVSPRTMGMGPVPATEKLLKRIGMSLDDFGVVELNEAFASQALAVLRSLGIPDDSTQVNPNGGAIALGHPLGMTGARLVATTVYEMLHAGHRFGLATMCIGVGQGIAMALELVA
ncbi:MAG: 3-oxoadipyl-CoA thiolase, partial [Acidimicrobiia bacterium]